MVACSQVAILFWIKEHLKYLYQQEVVFFSDIVTYENTNRISMIESFSLKCGGTLERLFHISTLMVAHAKSYIVYAQNCTVDIGGIDRVQ